MRNPKVYFQEKKNKRKGNRKAKKKGVLYTKKFDSKRKRKKRTKKCEKTLGSLINETCIHTIRHFMVLSDTYGTLSLQISRSTTNLTSHCHDSKINYGTTP